MLQSQLFTKTRKEVPSEEVSRNAKLLIKAGFVDKLQAGVYTYLPLGLRVLEKIANIIRDEMNRAGGQEILMPSLHPKENWEKTDRWNTMDDLYKIVDSSKKEFALGPTHEEIVVPLAKQFIASYRDLPMYVHQIQNKFRMELRSKSGVLRGREFLMKDFYSFHADEEDLDRHYEVMITAYKNIFKRVGLGDITHLTFASGGSFSKYSHEFQTVTGAGEDTIHICDSCSTAINEEIIAEQKECPECGGKKLKTEKAIEVGNTFKLKNKFSDPFGLAYKDSEGKDHPVIMGCYGIGLGRLMGAIVEVLADKAGIVWPASVAPFAAHVVEVKSAESANVAMAAQEIYGMLSREGFDTLYDDRNVNAGEKFADADLIGIPTRVVVSEKSIRAGGVEMKGRTELAGMIVQKEKLIDLLSKNTNQ